jgi:hypothetical protein
MSNCRKNTPLHLHTLPDLISIRRIKQYFIPIAAAIAAFGAGGIYHVAASETTWVPVLSPAHSRPAASGRTSRSNPQPLPHPIETETYYRYCKRCHGAGKMNPFPENHSGYAVKSCLNCHKPGSSPQSNDSGAEAAAVMSGKPGLIPHSVEETAYRDCGMCHSTGRENPFPADHARYVMESCTACHKPGAEPRAGGFGVEKESRGKPGLIPHSIEEDAYRNCTVCHGAGEMKPYPPDHIKHAIENCTDCHRPSSAGSQ